MSRRLESNVVISNAHVGPETLENCNAGPWKIMISNDLQNSQLVGVLVGN